MFRLVPEAALTLFVALAAFPAFADILLVHADGTGTYPTIQTAVDAAVDGDEAHLGNGSYFGEGNRDVRFLGKAITVRSESGNPDDVTICPTCDGSYPFHTFIFEGNEGPGSKLEGVSIEGAHTKYVMLGSVECHGSSPTFSRCRFSAIGTAVYSNGGNPMFDSCSFIGSYSAVGPALSASAATLVGCLFEGNISESDPAAQIGRAYIDECVFSGNVTPKYCGSLVVGPGTIVEDTEISGAGGIWGAVVCVSGPVTFRRGSISSTSEMDPKSLLISSGCVTIQGTNIARDEVSGCALWVRASQVDLTGSGPATFQTKSWSKIKGIYR